jgi:glucosamine-6-phosphate deaminase
VNFYDLTRAELLDRSPFPAAVVNDCVALDQQAAARIAQLIQENNRAGRPSSLILPVGPMQYGPLVAMLNRDRVALHALEIFMMDEFVSADGTPVAPTHPLSFRGFMRREFLAGLRPDLGFSEDRLIFPVPPDLETVSRRILEKGGVDLCIAGIGISGHLAFNDPPEPGVSMTVIAARNSVARIVSLNRETRTQIAMGGTGGNVDLIPSMAGTVGMKEILASRRLLLLGMRPWHAGLVRKALFGPVRAEFPASLLQEHGSVELLMTEVAAAQPGVKVTLDTGEAAAGDTAAA